MYERMLLESGKVFDGMRVSGVGADAVVDEEQTITIPVFIPEGEAQFISFIIPDTFIPGVPFVLGATIENVSSHTDDLFIRLTDTDTGEVLSVLVLPGIAPGATGSWNYEMVLVQDTDFHGLFEGGHIE